LLDRDEAAYQKENPMMGIEELKAETDVAVIIVDHEGTVSFINPMFETTWGWTEEDLVGKSLSTIIPANIKDAHHMGFSRFALTGEPTILNQALPLAILRSDGKKTVAEHFIVAEKINENWVFGATIKPLAADNDRS
jgi:PAS domain S-box-containing protein